MKKMYKTKWSLSGSGLHIMTQTENGNWFNIAQISYESWMDVSKDYPMDKEIAKNYAKFICETINNYNE